MDNSRRPFDRSREPGLKKPRLAEESGPSPIGRPFSRGPIGLATTTRFRSSDSDSSDLGRTSAYEPRPLPPQQLDAELVSQYKTALAELTFNSKPIITNLTIIAGENQHAAKAIAATVCANILEVPSDQKLPSLYLLDSIVKNIGRDYIKYFAARLPEVFCKAYYQVDPSVHSSMRHLFGTWKGVFPPQTLQIIEKKLAFASLANGSSSGTTSRIDTPSQRPPHSIHVNPKYLERQQLQQSSKAKVVVTKMTGAIPNSVMDAERPERATTISTRQTWVDPSAKMRSIQGSHREPLSGPLNEKSAAYEDYEYISGLSRNSGFASGGVSGRITVQPHDRPLYAVGNSIEETSQRNGFNVKPGFPNYLASKSSNIDGHPEKANSGASKGNNLLSHSWKNSEEEEFVWDTHSRGFDHDAPSIANNSKRDRWTPDGSENLPDLHEPEVILDTDSVLNEQKEQTTSGIQTQSQCLLSGLHKKDKLTGSGNLAVNSVPSAGYSGTYGGFPMTATSLKRTSTGQQVGSSHLRLVGSAIPANVLECNETFGRQCILSREAASPPGQSPLRQRSPSPSFQTRDPRKQLQYLVEREHPQVPRPDAKPSQHSGCLNARPKKQYSFSHPQQLDSLEHEPSGQNKKLLLPGVSDSELAGKADKVSERSVPPAVETTEQLGTSSVLTAVMKSRIFSNSIATSTVPGRESFDGGKLPSHSGVLTPVSFASTKAESAALLDSASYDAKIATINKSQEKLEQPPSPPGPLPSSKVGGVSAQTSGVESKAVNPLANLLTSLVAKGLISASKTESESSVPHQLHTQIQNKSPENSSTSSPPMSSVPVCSETHSSAGDEASFREPAAISSVALVDSTKKDVDNLIGLEFRPDVVREFHPSVISSLSDDLPHQCSLCGIRLKLQERLDRHLEWHAVKKTEQSGVGSLSRRWYVRSGDWVSGNVGDSGLESCDSLDESEKTTERSEVMVPADENQCACILCGELFEDYFNQERDEWMFKGAVYLAVQSKDAEFETTDASEASAPIVHEKCLSESLVHDLGVAGATKLEV